MCENAKAYGHAHIRGDATLTGTAKVCGVATVCGDAVIYADSWNKNPLYIQGTRHSLTNCAYKTIKIGCEKHSFDHWMYNFVEIGKKNKYSSKEIEEYSKYIELTVMLGK